MIHGRTFVVVGFKLIREKLWGYVLNFTLKLEDIVVSLFAIKCAPQLQLLEIN